MGKGSRRGTPYPPSHLNSKALSTPLGTTPNADTHAHRDCTILFWGRKPWPHAALLPPLIFADNEKDAAVTIAGAGRGEPLVMVIFSF